MGGSYEYGEIPISLDYKGDFIEDEYVFKYSWHAKAMLIRRDSEIGLTTAEITKK